jgi:hypothetical protein
MAAVAASRCSCEGGARRTERSAAAAAKLPTEEARWREGEPDGEAEPKLPEPLLAEAACRDAARRAAGESALTAAPALKEPAGERGSRRMDGGPCVAERVEERSAAKPAGEPGPALLRGRPPAVEGAPIAAAASAAMSDRRES